MHNVVVFDLGGVLVDWNPRYLYRKVFGGDEARVEWFLKNVCTDEWNHRHDLGVSFQENAIELVGRYPEYAKEIGTYFERFEECFGPPIAASVEILRELREKGTRLLALTNWSAETFPRARKMFPFFSWFEGMVVSGEVKLAKPDPKIYRLLCDRYDVQPKEALFIDDKEANVVAARELGFTGIHFRDPFQLRRELRATSLPLEPTDL